MRRLSRVVFGCLCALGSMLAFNSAARAEFSNYAIAKKLEGFKSKADLSSDDLHYIHAVLSEPYVPPFFVLETEGRTLRFLMSELYDFVHSLSPEQKRSLDTLHKKFGAELRERILDLVDDGFLDLAYLACDRLIDERVDGAEALQQDIQRMRGLKGAVDINHVLVEGLLSEHFQVWLNAASARRLLALRDAAALSDAEIAGLGDPLKLADPSRSEVFQAFAKLMPLAPEASFTALMNFALNDQTADEARKALNNIKGSEDFELPRFFEELDSGDPARIAVVVDALNHMDFAPRHLVFLEEKLNSNNVDIQREALKAMLQLPTADSKVGERVYEIAASGNGYTVDVAFAWMSAQLPQSRTYLRRLAESSKSHVRTSALLSFAYEDREFTDEEIAFLFKRFEDSNAAVLDTAIQAMVHLSPKSVPALTKGLLHSDPRVRLASAYAFDEIYPIPEESVRGLLKLTGDHIPVIRQAAVVALSGVDSPAQQDNIALSFAALLDDEFEVVSKSALLAIGTFRSRAKAAGPALLRRLDRPGVESVYLKVAFDEVPGLIRDLTQTEHIELRRAAAAQLSHLGLGARSAHSALVKALSSDDPELRMYAHNALLAIGADALPSLRSALASSDRNLKRTIVVLLGQMGPNANPLLPLLLILRDREEEQNMLLDIEEAINSIENTD